MAQPHQRHLDVDPRVRRLTHVDQGAAQCLQRPRDGGRRHTAGQIGGPGPFVLGHAGRSIAHRGEEGVAQPGQRHLPDRAGIPTPAHGVAHRRERGGPVMVGQRAEHGVGRGVELSRPTCGHDLFERGQRVAHRSAPCGHRMVDGLVIQVQLCVGDDVADVVGHDVGADQAQLEHLAAAADGLHHLVGLGRGQHPRNMGRRLLQGLEQRVLGAGGEHVDLVEQVHLGPARRCQIDPLEQAPHVVDLVVGGGIELLEVERAAVLDRLAGLADTAGLAVVAEVGAVQRLGQDPGRGGLAAAPRAVQQVGVADLVLAYGCLQGPNDMVLALDLGELLRPVAPVERLVGHRGGL